MTEAIRATEGNKISMLNEALNRANEKIEMLEKKQSDNEATIQALHIKQRKITEIIEENS